MNVNAEDLPLPPPSPHPTPPSAGGTDGVALAALVIGVGAVLASVVGIGVFFGIAAIVLGVAARGRARSAGRPVTLATAGVVLGIAGVVIGAGVVAAFVLTRGDPVAPSTRPRVAASVDLVELTTCEIQPDGRAVAAGMIRDPDAGGETDTVRVVFVRGEAVVGTGTDQVAIDDGGEGDFRVETRLDGADPVTCAVDDVSRG